MATHSEIGRQPKQSEKRELSQLAIYRIHIFVFPVIKESVQKNIWLYTIKSILYTKVTFK